MKEQQNPEYAAIAGAQAAAHYGLKIMKEGVETNPRNYTRFYIITRDVYAKELVPNKDPNRAVMIFSTPDKPGALFSALQILAAHGLNMKKLESRPILGKPWEYMFFVETEISRTEDFFQAVHELKEVCDSFRVLGTFNSSR